MLLMDLARSVKYCKRQYLKAKRREDYIAERGWQDMARLAATLRAIEEGTADEKAPGLLFGRTDWYWRKR